MGPDIVLDDAPLNHGLAAVIVVLEVDEGEHRWNVRPLEGMSEIFVARRHEFREVIQDSKGCPVLGLAGNNRQVNERTDSDLLRAYAENRSESAFAELVSRHVGLVYAVARWVVMDTHFAEDVTQATFAALSREARI